MSGRCSLSGHSINYDNINGCWRYKDNDEIVNFKSERPCVKCGQYPTEDGDDFCLQHLGKVINACCGHGDGKGYIQFDNGVTIRGYFEIERD